MAQSRDPSENQPDTDSHETFLRLWTHNEPELRAFVRACCPRAQEVDEVLQDVCIAAWRKFSTLDDHTAFGPWACLIARYELLMARRRYARDRLVLSEDIVNKLAEEGAEEISLRNRQLEALEQCIEKLPDDRRELALSAYARDMTIRQLAQRLKRSETSLYQLLFRIRKQLHGCIEQTLTHTNST